MKKKKVNKKELVKSVLIIVLALGILILLGRILKYQNFENDYTDWIGIQEKENDYYTGKIQEGFAKAVEPESIIISTEGKSTCIFKSERRFEDTLTKMKNALNNAKTELMGEVTADEWVSYAGKGGIHLRFMYDLTEENIDEIGIRKDTFAKEAESFCEILVSVEDKVLLLGTRDGKGYKFIFEYEKFETLDDFNIENGTCEYRKGMGFGPVPVGEYKLQVLTPAVPSVYKDNLRIDKITESMENLLPVYGYDVTTVRRYSDYNNALIFADATSSIKFTYDGTVEYSAVNKENGVEVGLLSSARGVYSIVYKTLKTFGVNVEGDMGIRLTNIRTEGEEIWFSFEYTYNGITVIEETPAITAVVTNGRMTKLYMRVRGYNEKGGETAENKVSGNGNIHLIYKGETEKKGSWTEL